MSADSRRHLYHHAAHRSIGVSGGLEYDSPASEVGPIELLAARKPLRLFFLFGQSDAALDDLHGALIENLCRRHDVQDGLLPHTGDAVATNFSEIERCDCLILMPGWQWADEGSLEAARQHLGCNGAVVAMGTNSDQLEATLASKVDAGWLDPPDVDGQLSRVVVRISESAENHPIPRDFRPFAAAGGFCRHPRLSDDARPLLVASTADGVIPVAWVRDAPGGGRFFTSLRDPSDFAQPSLVRLLAHAISWSVGTRPSPR